MQQEEALIEKGEPANRRWLRLLVQVAISLSVLALIYAMIDRERFFALLKDVNLSYVFAAWLVLLGIKTVVALRMRYYLSTINVHFKPWFAIKLGFFVSMLNHALPGGISGEGYTVWYGKKHHGVSIPDMLRRLVSSRANGLLWMLLFALLMVPFSESLKNYSMVEVYAAALGVCVIVGYSFSAEWLLKEPRGVQVHACIYSVVAQCFTFIMIWLLLLAFGVSEAGMVIDYIFLFILSCIVALLPISFGGAGVREMTFVLLAPFFAIDAETGVALSLAFFFLNFIAALLGMIFLFSEKKPRI